MGDAKRKLDEKKEAFEKDPDQFVDMHDIIVAAVRRTNDKGENGIGYLMSPNAPDHILKIALVDITSEINATLGIRKAMSEAERIKQEDSGIITPGGK